MIVYTGAIFLRIFFWLNPHCLESPMQINPLHLYRSCVVRPLPSLPLPPCAPYAACPPRPWSSLSLLAHHHSPNSLAHILFLSLHDTCSYMGFSQLPSQFFNTESVSDGFPSYVFQPFCPVKSVTSSFPPPPSFSLDLLLPLLSQCLVELQGAP